MAYDSNILSSGLTGCDEKYEEFTKGILLIELLSFGPVFFLVSEALVVKIVVVSCKSSSKDGALFLMAVDETTRCNFDDPSSISPRGI